MLDLYPSHAMSSFPRDEESGISVSVAAAREASDSNDGAVQAPKRHRGSTEVYGRPTSVLRQLFRKELTPSDVGKLNRLVIPKKYAVRHLPAVEGVRSRSEGEVEGMMVEVTDMEGRSWEFRYCYWRSSQSFVFTKGWNRFVRSKGLKAKDTVVFYGCGREEEDNGKGKGNDGDGEGRACFFVIDVEHTSGGESMFLNGDAQRVDAHGHVPRLVADRKKREGVWLFGVQIGS